MTGEQKSRRWEENPGAGVGRGRTQEIPEGRKLTDQELAEVVGKAIKNALIRIHRQRPDVIGGAWLGKVRKDSSVDVLVYVPKRGKFRVLIWSELEESD